MRKVTNLCFKGYVEKIRYRKIIFNKDKLFDKLESFEALVGDKQTYLTE